eukprot:COSAG02_NODE_13_length_57813_cov_14.298276_4_plen_122_part_00
MGPSDSTTCGRHPPCQMTHMIWYSHMVSLWTIAGCHSVSFERMHAGSMGPTTTRYWTLVVVSGRLLLAPWREVTVANSKPPGSSSRGRGCESVGLGGAQVVCGYSSNPAKMHLACQYARYL